VVARAASRVEPPVDSSTAPTARRGSGSAA
jgi:hypothetical protein